MTAALTALSLHAPATSAEIPQSLEDACELRDAADGALREGRAELPYWFCDDGVPQDGGGTDPNPDGSSAVEVPAAYEGFLGLPDKDLEAAVPPGESVPGADAEGNVALDVDVSLPDPDKFPPSESPDGYPLVVFMHGCCAGSKNSWEADTIFAAGSAEEWHHSNVWFAARGYVVLTYTARGFVDGNGTPAVQNDDRGSTGQTQLNHRSFEINDYQHLAGLLADTVFTVAGEPVRIDGERVVTIGGSYGGGFSWMALTDPTWRSPGGKPMRLVATAPKYGWTDLAYSLVPNGAHLEDGLEDPDGADTSTPLGFPKQSIVAGLYASGKTGLPSSFDHTTFEDDIDRALFCLQVVNPELIPPCNEFIKTVVLPTFIQDRSAYYQDHFFEGLASGAVDPVPVYSAGALTDPLFPGREHRRMAERLKAIAPGYPIKQYYGDYQHFVQNKRKEWSDLCGPDDHVCTIEDYPNGNLNLDPVNLSRAGINDDLSDFVDFYADPPGNPNAERPANDVRASLQICPQNASGRYPPDQPGPRFSAASFDALAPNTLTFSASGEQRTTWLAANPHAEFADPVTNLASNQGRCPPAPGPPGQGVASYQSSPLEQRYTMIGPTRVSVPYTSTGSELQLNARLYDVFPDGSEIMVDRGYRTLTDPAGTALFYLIGNGWRFESGHRLRVELIQDDAPYLRTSTRPSSMSLAGVRLQIPVREASATIGVPDAGEGDPARPNEDVPTRPDEDVPAPPGESGRDRDCSDFGSHQEAQEELDEDPGDPHRLDRDRDGLACEALDGEGAPAAGEPVATGEVPFTGFALLPPILLGAGMVLAGAALRRRIR